MGYISGLHFMHCRPNIVGLHLLPAKGGFFFGRGGGVTL